MKAGPYAGYSLDEIIDIKKKEQNEIGHFFWGYSGVFSRPHHLEHFLRHAQENNSKIHVLFSKTESAYNLENPDRLTHFSENQSYWNKLDERVLLVGNASKPHFAITGKDLKEADFEIDLANYRLLEGMFPEHGRPLNRYFGNRVDKAYGYYLPTDEKPKEVHIDYIAELTAPFSVYVRQS
jgi:hypothetical protein